MLASTTALQGMRGRAWRVVDRSSGCSMAGLGAVESVGEGVVENVVGVGVGARVPRKHV